MEEDNRKKEANPATTTEAASLEEDPIYESDLSSDVPCENLLVGEGKRHYLDNTDILHTTAPAEPTGTTGVEKNLTAGGEDSGDDKVDAAINNPTDIGGVRIVFQPQL
jgi:hypothetical protein